MSAIRIKATLGGAEFELTHTDVVKGIDALDRIMLIAVLKVVLKNLEDGGGQAVLPQRPTPNPTGTTWPWTPQQPWQQPIVTWRADAGTITNQAS